jgi:hypothetical protein
LPEFDDPYKILLNLINLYRAKKVPGLKKNYSLEKIGQILGTNKGNVSKLIKKLSTGIDLPPVETVIRYIELLEATLVEEPPHNYLTRQQEHTEEIRSLNIKVENLEKNVEKILALLEKDSGAEPKPPSSN